MRHRNSTLQTRAGGMTELTQYSLKILDHISRARHTDKKGITTGAALVDNSRMLWF
jgi:hypothetical protein